MPTNTVISENGSSYQIRDNPLYGAAGTTAPQLYAVSEISMAEQSSGYSVSNPVCENYEIRVCPVVPMNVPNTEKTGLLQPLFLSWKYV
jgi:hypothetical protein